MEIIRQKSLFYVSIIVFIAFILIMHSNPLHHYIKSPEFQQILRLDKRKPILNQTIRTSQFLPDDLQCADQNDRRLIEHIQREWVQESQRIYFGPENHKVGSYISQYGQDKFIDKLLDEQQGGFYVECGAANGYGLSNTVFFDEMRAWDGLLIEANPRLFKRLLQGSRDAYLVNACLSPRPISTVNNFTNRSYTGGITDFLHENPQTTERHLSAKVQSIPCLPLISILKAINVSTIDYFSLDVEGAELDILRTIPFDEVDIKLWTIEFRVVNNGSATQSRLKALRELMVNRYGYEEVTILNNTDIVLRRR